jgi:predicted nucleic acid-binding protein
VAVFVDTGAWFAASVPSDNDHVAATAFMKSNTDRLVTTDFIYDELLTLFRARGYTDRAADWVEQVRQNHCDMVRVTTSDIQNATDVFFRFHDKEWSFTDCTSRVVMERLGINQAFSFDEHFRQFGTVTVVPS